MEATHNSNADSLESLTNIIFIILGTIAFLIIISAIIALLLGLSLGSSELVPEDSSEEIVEQIN
jgi:hypothetical protein